MAVVDISSPSNPLIKRLRSLHDKKGRRDGGLFLAEGLRVCTEALAAGHVPQVFVFAAETEAHPLARKLIDATVAGGGQAVRATRDLLQKLTGKDNAQGCCAAFAIPDTSLARIDRMTAPMWLVVENLKDPGNLGTMLRTCDATGAGGVILLDHSCDPFSVEAVRAAMGGTFSRALAQASAEAFFAWLRAGPGQLVGAALDGAVVDYRALAWQPPVFLFLGNEQSGLPADHAALCDARVRLPMKGAADSLNVAVAGAVLLYHILDRLEPLK